MANLRSNIIVSERLENRMLRDIKDIQDEVSRLVAELLRGFDTRGGRFVPNNNTAFIINTLNPKIREIIRRTRLNENFLSYVDDFSQLDRNTSSLQQELNGIRVPNDIYTQARAWIVDNVVSSLTASISTDFAQPVKNILYERITTGGSVLEAETALRNLVNGSEGKLGVFERHVGQIARDAVNDYNGTVNSKIKQEFKLNAIRYAGGLVEDSRCQCRKWVAMGTIKDDQLQAEIDWAYSSSSYTTSDGEVCRPSGMKPDTTVDNFPEKRGGYNCTHIAIPVMV